MLLNNNNPSSLSGPFGASLVGTGVKEESVTLVLDIEKELQCLRILKYVAHDSIDWCLLPDSVVLRLHTFIKESAEKPNS